MQNSPGAQRFFAPRDFAAKNIETVGAPLKRKRRLEGRHFLGDFGHDGGRDIGRVGNNQVKLADRRFGHARRKVAFHHAHAVGQPERLRVLARKRNGVRRDVGGDDARVGTLVGDGASDAPRARAQVGHVERF